jgi:hypothetical protein
MREPVSVIEMGMARTLEEREAVFRFWYSVYVEEMGRYQAAADHVNRLLFGPEDALAGSSVHETRARSLRAAGSRGAVTASPTARSSSTGSSRSSRICRRAR